MFGLTRKLVSAKRKVFNVFRLIGGLENEDSNVSSPSHIFEVAPYELVKPLRKYSLEAEFKKAQALAYWRMLENRPK